MFRDTLNIFLLVQIFQCFSLNVDNNLCKRIVTSVYNRIKQLVSDYLEYTHVQISALTNPSASRANAKRRIILITGITCYVRNSFRHIYVTCRKNMVSTRHTGPYAFRELNNRLKNDGTLY